MLVPQEEEVLHALAEEVDYYNSMGGSLAL